MDTYLIEVWRKQQIVASYIGLPEDLEQHADYTLRSWFKALSSDRKWKVFCETFDSFKHSSGTLSFDGHTIRISSRKSNDNI